MSDDVLKNPANYQPEDRVVKAGIALFKLNKKMPTQDQVVVALSQSKGKGTPKVTVNKYWPSLQAQIAHDLSLKDWLPAELPDFISDQLKAIFNWAISDTEKKLEKRTSELNERERLIVQQAEEQEWVKKELRSQVRDLKNQLLISNDNLSQKNTELISTQKELFSLQKDYSIQTNLLALTTESLSSAENKNKSLDESILVLQKKELDYVKEVSELKSKIASQSEKLTVFDSLQKTVEKLEGSLKKELK